MALILAIEPDRRQASQLTAMVRGRLHAELVLAESAERALTALGDRVPDLVLTSALLSPKDETALVDRLRALDGNAAHVQTLTIPVLATHSSHGVGRASGVLSALRRGKDRFSTHEGCDPAVFAEQCKEYLERAATEREIVLEQAASIKEPPRPVSPSPVTGSEWVVVHEEEQLETASPPHEATAAAYDLVPEEDAVPAEAPVESFVVDQEPYASADAVAPDPMEPSPRVDRVLREFLDLTSDDGQGPASLLAAVAALEAEEQIYAAPPAADDNSERAVYEVPPEPASVEPVEPVDVSAPASIVRPPEESEFVDLSSLLQPYTNHSTTNAPAFEPEPSTDIYELDATTLNTPIDSEPDAPAAAASNRLATLSDLEDIFANTPEFAPAQVAPAAPAAAANTVDDLKEWVDIIEALRRDAEQLEARRPALGENVPNTAAVPSLLELPPIFAEPAEPVSTEPVEAPADPVVPPAEPIAMSADQHELSAERDEKPPEAVPAVASAAPEPAASAGESHAAPPSDPAGKRKRKRAKNGPAQDEWGFFDPEQCGFAALIERLEEITDKDDTPAPRRA